MSASLAITSCECNHPGKCRYSYCEVAYLAGFIFVIGTLTSTRLHADEYIVQINSNDLRLAHVEAIIDSIDGQLAMKSDRLEGNSVNGSWADYVRNLRLVDATESELALTRAGLGIWDAHDYPGGPVHLSYDVGLEFDKLGLWMGSDGAAYVAETGVMWSGRALFIAGRPTDNVTVSFDLPSDWIVSTPWPRANQKTFSFQPTGTDDLLNSAFMAGTHIAFDVRAGNVDLNVALSGAYSMEQREDYESWLREYLEYYTRRYGNPAETHALLIASDLDSDGFFNIGSEVMGYTITMVTSTGAFWLNRIGLINIAAEAGHVLSHELFHFFAKGIVLTDQRAGFDEWFNEGFTAEYASWTSMLRLGVISEDEFLEELSEQWYEYLSAVDGTLTLGSAGVDKSGNESIVYSGGFIAALALVFFIRDQSNGSQSLDDLWIYLINEFPVEGTRRLSYGELLATVELLFGNDVRKALDDFVTSPRAIPFSENAEHLGLEFKKRWPYFFDDHPPLRRHNEVSASQQLLWQGFMSP